MSECWMVTKRERQETPLPMSVLLAERNALVKEYDKYPGAMMARIVDRDFGAWLSAVENFLDPDLPYYVYDHVAREAMVLGAIVRLKAQNMHYLAYCNEQ